MVYEMIKLDKETGLYYDLDNGSVSADKEGKQFLGSFNPVDKSKESLRLFLLSIKFSDDPKESAKIRKKIDIQYIHDLPYIIATPEHLYSYVLYKLRKLSGYTQEGMALSIGMSKSTYNKIENRILSPSLNNLHTIMHLFQITPVEFSQLYWNIETVVRKFKHFYIPCKNSDLNSDTEIYLDNPDYPDHERTTPVHLYDEKIPSDILNNLEISFQEVLLEGKKRNAELEERRKAQEAEELASFTQN